MSVYEPEYSSTRSFIKYDFATKTQLRREMRAPPPFHASHRSLNAAAPPSLVQQGLAVKRQSYP